MDCILWEGFVNPSGYGQTGNGGKTIYAHRQAWEKVNGPIPDAMTIDHICKVKLCINPDHMQVVSRGKNVKLRWERDPAPALCKNGHDSWKKRTQRGRTYRYCTACQAERERAKRCL